MLLLVFYYCLLSLTDLLLIELLYNRYYSIRGSVNGKPRGDPVRLTGLQANNK